MERVRPGSTFIYLFPTNLPSLCYMPNTVLVLGKNLAFGGTCQGSQNQKLPMPSSNINEGAMYMSHLKGEPLLNSSFLLP